MVQLTTSEHSPSKSKDLKRSSAQINIDFLRACASAMIGLETALGLKQKEARTWPNSFLAIPPRPKALEEISRAVSQLTLNVLRGGSCRFRAQSEGVGMVRLDCCVAWKLRTWLCACRFRILGDSNLPSNRNKFLWFHMFLHKVEHNSLFVF